MTVILRPETVTRLRARAERDGQDISALADALLMKVLMDDPDALTDEEATVVCAGIRQGLAAAETRHVKPLAQAVTEVRQRHGFPHMWHGAQDSLP